MPRFQANSPDHVSETESSDLDLPSPNLFNNVNMDPPHVTLQGYVITRFAPLFYDQLIDPEVQVCDIVQSLEELAEQPGTSPVYFYHHVKFERTFCQKAADVKIAEIILERKRLCPDLRIEIVQQNGHYCVFPGPAMGMPMAQEVFVKLMNRSISMSTVQRWRVHRQDMQIELRAAIVNRLSRLEFAKAHGINISNGLVVLYQHDHTPDCYYLTSYANCETIADIHPSPDYMCQDLKVVTARYFDDRFSALSYLRGALRATCTDTVRMERVVIDTLIYSCLEGLDEERRTFYVSQQTPTEAREYMLRAFDQAVAWFLHGVECRWFACDVRVFPTNPKHAKNYELAADEAAKGLRNAIMASTIALQKVSPINMVCAWEGARTQMMYVVIELDKPITEPAMSESMVKAVEVLNRQPVACVRTPAGLAAAKFATVERISSPYFAEKLLKKADVDASVAMYKLSKRDDEKFEVITWADTEHGGFDWWSLPDEIEPKPGHMGMYARFLNERVIALEEKCIALDSHVISMGISNSHKRGEIEQLRGALSVEKKRRKVAEMRVEEMKTEKGQAIVAGDMYRWMKRHLVFVREDLEASARTLTGKRAAQLQQNLGEVGQMLEKVQGVWDRALTDSMAQGDLVKMAPEVRALMYSVASQSTVVGKMNARGEACVCVLQNMDHGEFRGVMAAGRTENVIVETMYRRLVETKFREHTCCVCRKAHEDAYIGEGRGGAEFFEQAKRAKLT